MEKNPFDDDKHHFGMMGSKTKGKILLNNSQRILGIQCDSIIVIVEAEGELRLLG